MVELLAVVVVVGVLSVAALSRNQSTDIQSLLTEADLLRSNLRYAQTKALADNVSWSISLTGTTYTLVDGGGGTTMLPSDTIATHTLTGGVTITTGVGTSASFDNWGSPGAADKTIVLTLGASTQTITITKNTGFIQ